MKNDLNGIEVLRFLCAIAVILTHYHLFFQLGTWHAVAQTTYPLYAILSPAYDGGHWAVEFFWVISGFIFYWRYAELVQSRQTGAREFAVRRISRLYPLHFVTLLAVAVGQYVYFRNHSQAFIFPDNSANAFSFQLLLASNWFTQDLSFNAPIWSVSVEILTYAAFFLVVRRFGSNPFIALGVGLLSWTLLKLWPRSPSQSVFECGLFFFLGGAASST
jgi:peptidoglycan/LPS O-acetylase OafA/YrhL